MMGNTKKEFKWFTITQYKQEEEYLSFLQITTLVIEKMVLLLKRID